MHNVTIPPIRVHESAIDYTVSSDVHDHSNLLGPSPSFSTYPKDITIAVREPESCSGLTIDTTFHDNNKDYHVNQHPLPRACETISEKLDGSYLSMTHKKKLHEKTKHQQVDINPHREKKIQKNCSILTQTKVNREMARKQSNLSVQNKFKIQLISRRNHEKTFWHPQYVHLTKK